MEEQEAQAEASLSQEDAHILPAKSVTGWMWDCPFTQVWLSGEGYPCRFYSALRGRKTGWLRWEKGVGWGKSAGWGSGRSSAVAMVMGPKAALLRAWRPA